jgi:hypothetical protein
MVLIVVKTPGKVFAICPRAFPKALDETGKILRRDSKVKAVFAYRSDDVLEFCRNSLKWEPMTVHDVADMCAERGWKANLDVLMDKAVSGKFCRRASIFFGNSLPSAQVLKHRPMAAALIYDFGLKFWRGPRRGVLAAEDAKTFGESRDGSGHSSRRDRSPLRRVERCQARRRV